jgi:site-specific DNA-methyltransferase (adenine-specific)
VKFLPITQIEVAPNRQRREFDPALLQELVAGIRDSAHGLLHPLVVREVAGQYVLVAGERRLRAIQDIYQLDGTFKHGGASVPPGTVPVIGLGELSDLDAEEAELEENIRRVDLTWSERATATARLMSLRTRQAAGREDPTPSVAAVALEVRPDGDRTAALDAARKELIVAKHLDDAEVRAAPSLNEAFKILKKKETARQNIALAETVGRTFSSRDHTLINGDSLEWMQQTILAGSFDIILTDPPYGMGADKFGDSGTGSDGAAHFYDDSQSNWRDLINVFARESFRLAKAEAHCYAFCDLDNFTEFRYIMKEAGWKVHRTPLVWHNPDGFRAPWPEQGPQRKYELILYAVKGDKRTTALRGDVLEYRKDRGEGHPAQKPVPLLIDLLRRSARPGDRVLDPFAGSGSSLVACHELSLTCTALEMDAGAYGIAARRLAALSSQPELPL